MGTLAVIFVEDSQVNRKVSYYFVYKWKDWSAVGDVKFNRQTHAILYEQMAACYIEADVSLHVRTPNCGIVASICFEPPFSVELDEEGLSIESRWANFLSFASNFLYASGCTARGTRTNLTLLQWDSQSKNQSRWQLFHLVTTFNCK